MLSYIILLYYILSQKGKFIKIDNNSTDSPIQLIFHNELQGLQKSMYRFPCFASLHCIFSKTRRPRQRIRPPGSAKRGEDAYKVWSDVEKTRVVFAHRGTFTARQGRTYSPSSVKFFLREYINGIEFSLKYVFKFASSGFT